MTRNPEALADPIDVAVGARIRLLRKLRGLSQQALAESAGVTFQQIQKYERGANRTSGAALVRMGRALGVPASYFLEGLEGEDGGMEYPALAPEETAVRDLLLMEGGVELATRIVSLSLAQRRVVVDLVRVLTDPANS